MTFVTEHKAVTAAKVALRRNPYAPFPEQQPHLRQLIAHLPVLPVTEPVSHLYPLNKAKQTDGRSILAFLQHSWICYAPINSHEAATKIEISNHKALLEFTFHTYMWGTTGEQGTQTVARIGKNRYLYWRRRFAEKLGGFDDLSATAVPATPMTVTPFWGQVTNWISERIGRL